MKVFALLGKLGLVKTNESNFKEETEMSLVLARIDQRLIHGIVVTQWAGATQAKRLMVVDDEVSKDEVQKSAMRMSKPVGTGMSIIDTETAIKNHFFMVYLLRLSCVLRASSASAEHRCPALWPGRLRLHQNTTHLPEDDRSPAYHFH